MSLTYRGVAPVLIVARVEPTKAFFADRLGFAVVAEVMHDGAPGFVMLEKDDVTIMVQSHASVLADVGDEAKRAIDDTVTSERGAATLFVTVNDVEQIVPIIADADVIVPLRKTFYGMHEITIREPGGHAVTFASELAS